MKYHDYKQMFEVFISEMIKLDISEFGTPEKWTLCTDVLNGVKIGYELPTKSSRLLLHVYGQKHGLIPLCPDDVIDLKLSKEYVPECMIVISKYGELKIDRVNDQ